MKKLILCSVALLCFEAVMSQAPQAFQYQAVVRNALGNPVINQPVNFKLSIIYGSPGGTVEYVETHSALTNPFGVAGLEVGNGTPVSGTFATINWESAPHYIKVEADPAGGTNYFDMGTAQLLSVPYALYSLKTGSSGDTLWELSGNDIFNKNQGNVGVGINNPLARLVVQGSATASDTLPLFEVKNAQGQTIFVVYPDSVHVFVFDDATKSNKGGFAVSGRNNAKQVTNDFLKVTPDSTRIYTGDSETGFGIRSIGSSSKTSYVHIVPDNYFIGHEAGQKMTTGFGNTFFGYQSGFGNTSGSENVFIGQYSGFSNTSGNNNVFIGNLSGYSCLKGEFNVCMGHYSGYSIDSAFSNVMIGPEAGFNNTLGSNNTFIGDQAGYSNIGGQSNIFIGIESGYSNRVGNYNVCLGNSTGYALDSAESNVFIGDQAGYNTTTGSYNTFLGDMAGLSNTTGTDNIFIGTNSGRNNTTGSLNICLGNNAGEQMNNVYSNIFIGAETGLSNSNGNENMFIGEHAGRSNINGDNNLFFGVRSGLFNYSGDGNIFVGTEAGRNNLDGHYNIFIGEGSGYSNLGNPADSSMGSNNLFLGQGAGFLNETGSYNIFLGSGCGLSNFDGTDNIYIGSESGDENNGSNNVYIGALSGKFISAEDSRLRIDSREISVYSEPLIYGEFDNRRVVINGDESSNVFNRTFFVNGDAGGTLSWFNDSDKRLKKNITTIPNALDKIMKLRGVNFEWIDTRKYQAGLQVGFVAQEVMDVLPEVISKTDECYSMSYAPVTAVLVEAVKEQQKIIEEQKKEIGELKKLVENNRAELSKELESIRSLFIQVSQK